jgi:RHS repeat-associated protein
VLADHLHTPRRLQQTQLITNWQWPYSAFGEEPPTQRKYRFVNPATVNLGETTTAAPLNYNLRFPGQLADAESGLFYNYFRSYDPRQGRYSQSDPIGLSGGWNRFGYAESNPLKYTDPTGEIATSPNMSPAPGAQGGTELCFSDGCAAEKQRCTALCSVVRFDSDMRNIWGGSFRRCMNGCMPARCGGNPV